MKKNLLYLFMALFAMTFMTACGDDDDKDTGDKTAEIIANAAGTYTQGKVAIYILGEAITNWNELPETADIEITRNLNVELAADGSKAVSLTIKNLDLTNGADPDADLMTLSVPAVPVNVIDGAIAINSTDKTWSVPIMNGLNADVNKIIGTIKDNKIDLQLSAWQNDLQQFVYISVVVTK
ncbi:hypothetical protein [Coprobacter sp.]